MIHIETPALREVPEDIPLLANHFLEKYSKLMKTEPKQFTPAALECLTSYQWPGNERQLENEIKRLVASVRGKTIDEEHIDPSIRSSEKTLASSTIPSALKTPQTENAPETSRSLKSLPDAVEALERRMIAEALRESGGNKQKAAQALGLSRQGLIKKVEEAGDLNGERLCFPSMDDVIRLFPNLSDNKFLFASYPLLIKSTSRRRSAILSYCRRN